MTKLLLCLLAACSCIWAQADANKGQIVGTIYDPNEAVVPAAKVKIVNTETGAMRELTTNEAGQYRAVLLDPGNYEVTVEKDGFAPARLTGMTLSVGSAITADITLLVGSTAQTIEVGATFVDVTMPSPSTVLNTLAITNLPISGRRFHDFALLTPTVQIDPDRGQLSFAGQRGINANVMVDGSDYNQPFFGGIRGGERSNKIFTVPQTAIREFQVVTTGYSAEYGRSTGGVLNAITKSGTNETHGEAFYQLRHKELGAETPFNRQILETQHQFGGGAGGPIIRDKLFWFAAAERQDASTPRQIVFGPLASITPTANTQEAYNFYRSLEQGFKSTNDATAVTGRTDWQMSDNHRLALRYNFSKGTGVNEASVGGPVDTLTNIALTANGNEEDMTHSGVAQLTSIFGATVANDFRFSTSYEDRPRTANSISAGVQNTIGQFGTRSFFPTTQDDRRIQLADGLSWSRGPHTFKFGMDYSYVTAAQIFGFNQTGNFNFTTTNVNTILDILSPGGTVANRFDDPAVQYTRQIGNLTAELALHQLAFFAQDSWRVLPNLTLDLGLRWEAQYNPEPEANNTALVDAVRGFRFPNGLSVDPTSIPDQTKQLMPRFGFAWSPLGNNQRTVVRGHTGIFYAATPLLLFAGARNNFRLPPGDVSVSLPRAGSTVYRDMLAVGIDLNRGSLDQLPILTVEQVQQAAAGGGTIDPFRGARLLTNAMDYKNPRAFQAGLGVDHEITRSWVAGVQLNYVNTVHLQRNRDYNLQAPVIRPNDASQRPFISRSPRPIATLDRITIRETNARSMYRGATFSSQLRRGRFQFGAFYTLSQTFSDDDNERNATGLFYDNPYNLQPEYWRSDLDRRHQFAGHVVVSLPGDIEISSAIRMFTGRPIDPNAGSDLNGDGINEDRAYSAPGVPYRRNEFRNRGFKNIDLRFLKNFPLWNDRTRIQFSAELFNAFNFDNVYYDRTNLNYGPGIDATSGQVVAPLPTFRRLRLATGEYDPTNNQAGTPLQAQFGLRFFF
jgi:hypothetical protein